MKKKEKKKKEMKRKKENLIIPWLIEWINGKQRMYLKERKKERIAGMIGWKCDIGKKLWKHFGRGTDIYTGYSMSWLWFVFI